MQVLKKVLNVLATVILAFATLLVIAVFILRITGAKPKLMGYYFFNVVSDSMEPMLKVDDVILVKACTGDDVKKGDVITFHGKIGELAGKDITHKVVSEPIKSADGVTVIQTQGIKKGAVKDEPITGDQVLGKYVKKLNVLGFVYKIFKQWYGLLIFLAVLMALMGKEVYNLRKLSQKSDKLDEALKELQEFENSKAEETSQDDSQDNSSQ